MSFILHVFLLFSYYIATYLLFKTDVPIILKQLAYFLSEIADAHNVMLYVSRFYSVSFILHVFLLFSYYIATYLLFKTDVPIILKQLAYFSG